LTLSGLILSSEYRVFFSVDTDIRAHSCINNEILLGAQLLKLNLKSFSLVAANIYYDDIIMLPKGTTVPREQLPTVGVGVGVCKWEGLKYLQVWLA